MSMWVCTILLKDSLVIKNFMSIFYSYKKYVFDDLNSSFIQDHQVCETLGRADTQPHHHILSGKFCFCITPPHPHRHQHNLLPTHLHFQNDRHYQCQRIFREKTEFFRCLLYPNPVRHLFPFDHQKVMIRLSFFFLIRFVP